MLRNLIHLAVAVAWASVPGPAQVRPFGAGCATHLSREPSMSSTAPMVAGSPFDIDLDAVAASAPFILVFGLSNTSWNGLSLPLDMAPFGFVGCTLNVGYDKVFGLTSGSTGHLLVPVAGNALPAGARLYAQMVVPEPNGVRIATSQGYELTIQKSIPPFSVAVLPDTQNYVVSASLATLFDAMTRWIVGNKATRNIAFASHVGDVVKTGASGTNQNQEQWDRAVTAMKILDGDLTSKPDGELPYSVAVGNRDYDVINDKTAWNRFAGAFGPSRYTGRSWFKGIGPDGLNMYEVFEADGFKYLHVMLEWRPRDLAIEWAQGILTANAELPTIVTTHQYLGTGSVVYDDSGATPNDTGDNGGLGVRHKLIEPFPQVFLVLGGHNFGGGHQLAPTILGRPVVEILADYSFDPNGGNGWMNLVTGQLDQGKLDVACISPTYIPGTTIGIDRRSLPQNNGTYDLDLHLLRRFLETTVTLRFTGGHDHGHGVYQDALDTFVDSSAANAVNGAATDVAVDDPAGAAEVQGLLKFGKLFGAAAGQVPPNKRIVQAILTLTTEGVGSPSTTGADLYQLKIPFDEQSTWNSLSQGVTIGVDTEPTAVASTGNAVDVEGTRSFDVTRSLRSWQSGTTNHGWALVNRGADLWSFRSKEWSGTVERPMLTVIYEK